MSTFTIDQDNNITASQGSPQAGQEDAAGLIPFSSEAELGQVSTEWPMSRFVEIWNSIPGHTLVKRFQDRKTAVKKVWNAIQPLVSNGPAEAVVEKPKASKPTKSAKKVEAADQGKQKKTGPKPGREKAPSHTKKKAQVTALMQRAKGVTLADIMEVTGWQAHTIRGFISILGSKGALQIESSKNAAGERTYKIAR